MVRKKKCGELIKQINDELRKNANNEMRSQGLTATQANTLVELYYAPEQQLSMKDLEERLHVAQSTVVGIVSRLEQKKLVESFSHSSDKRIKLVRITQAGAAFFVWLDRGRTKYFVHAPNESSGYLKISAHFQVGVYFRQINSLLFIFISERWFLWKTKIWRFSAMRLFPRQC